MPPIAPVRPNTPLAPAPLPAVARWPPECPGQWPDQSDSAPACMQGMDKPLAQLRSGLAGGIGVSMGLSQKSGNKSHFVLGTNVVSSRSVVKVKSGGLLSLESVQESWRQLRAKVRQPCHVEFLVPQFVADKTCSPDVFS